MSTVNDDSVVVNLNFTSGNITIDGKQFNEILANYAPLEHTHVVNDVENLETRLSALESKNVVTKDGTGNVSLPTGKLTIEDIEYFDGLEWVSSLAAKIADLEGHFNTIEHLTLTCDTNVKVGYPVFSDDIVLDKNFSTNNLTSVDCVPVVKSSGTNRTYLGVCTEVNATHKGLTEKQLLGKTYAFTRYATHGDYQFHVDNTSKYTVGDTIDYIGNVIADDTPCTVGLVKTIVGTITEIFEADNKVAVFKN